MRLSISEFHLQTTFMNFNNYHESYQFQDFFFIHAFMYTHVHN